MTFVNPDKEYFYQNIYKQKRDMEEALSFCRANAVSVVFHTNNTVTVMGKEHRVTGKDFMSAVALFGLVLADV